MAGLSLNSGRWTRRQMIAGVLLVIGLSLVAWLVIGAGQRAAEERADDLAIAFRRAAEQHFEKRPEIVQLAKDGTSVEAAEAAAVRLRHQAEQRPRLETFRTSLPAYQSARQLDEALGRYYQRAQSYLNRQLIPYLKLADALNGLDAARDQALAAYRRQPSADTIRRQSVPALQAAIAKLQSVEAPAAGAEVKQQSVTIHQTFARELAELADDLEAGRTSSGFDLTAQLNQLLEQRRRLQADILKQAEPIQDQAEAISNRF